MGKGKNLLAITLAMILIGCTPEPAAETGSEVKTADALVVTKAPLHITEDLPGRVVAVRQAEVRARVAGIVLKREFAEGSLVSAGQVLFQLDPAPLRVALAKAQAELAKAKAAQQEADDLLRRYKPLLATATVSQHQFDNAKTNLLSAAAAVQAAEADLDNATLNLSYSRVTAPIAGRIGRALVSEGALVGQNEATQLAVIHQLDPVYVDMNLSSGAEMQRQQSIKQGHAQVVNQLNILDNAGQPAQQGQVLFAESQVDQNTGTLTLRAEFANKDQQLLPGMYVKVRTRLGFVPDAILIPQRALSRDHQGQQWVWVQNKNGEAEPREVRTGVMVGKDWQITAGLAAGDIVLTSATSQLQSGDKVQVQLADDLKHAAATASPVSGSL
ncbi:efflux RND transporter periplasmic adaptor subunit [Rheinheimera sp.]|uniref:efflux RND transporter periplasmic adaptor subunit n=1 Tax=Rheinheimera sp. TaxID=1869214 RepID=UPI002602F8AB|nr:efflux RND transporter periplasmic adaptor subunit [Rheinheimera sp.]MCA1929679.1 efflux RND transporter periplasmic adaptor subunit [Rheinheimera sp.]